MPISRLSADPGWHALSSSHERALNRVLTVEEVSARLQNCMLRHCDDRSRRVPIAAVATLCEVTRETIYQAARGQMSEITRVRLSAVLRWIEDDTLRFRRVGRETWLAEWRTPPNPLPPPQDRMTRAVDWNEWSRCRSCGGARWTRVTLHGTSAVWYLCDTCTWWETAGLGARPVERPRSAVSQSGRSSL